MLQYHEDLKKRVEKSNIKYYNKNHEILKAFENFTKDFKRIKEGLFTNIMSKNNNKLDEHVISWAIAEGIFCNKACKRCKNCYVENITCMRDKCRINYNKNGLLVSATLKDKIFNKAFYDNIFKILRHHADCYKEAICRWHVSGDFFANKYLHDFLRLVDRCQNIDLFFYTYTRQLSEKYIKKINKKYKNLNIVSSKITYCKNGVKYQHDNVFNLNLNEYKKELNILNDILTYFRAYNKRLKNKLNKGLISYQYFKENYKIIGFCNYAKNRKNEHVISIFENLLKSFKDVAIIPHGHECMKNCKLCQKLLYVGFIKH